LQDAGYLTVKGYGEREIVIQKSRFIAQVDRAKNEEEAKAFVQRIKKRHWNATHNCSAYVIGEGNGIQKANDDGEPGGTAGVPILEVLLKKGLRDTVVVVTRYFGGIKLGAGGLIRAYGRAAAEGIEAAGIVKRSLMRSMTAGFDYTWLGKDRKRVGRRALRIKGNQVQTGWRWIYWFRWGKRMLLPHGWRALPTARRDKGRRGRVRGNGSIKYPAGRICE
jgi:uncharacterized YigZ family protein